MNDFFIGDIIRDERIKRGMSQAQLCEGICEIPTLSRIENGKQCPKRELLERLLSKLGLVAARYYGLSSCDELEMEELKLEIKDANARLDFAEALRLLEKWKLKFADNENPIRRQFFCGGAPSTDICRMARRWNTVPTGSLKCYWKLSAAQCQASTLTIFRLLG